MNFLKLFLPKRPKIRIRKIEPQGEHCDLKEVFQRVNARYFENQLDLPIGWFGRKDATPRTSIRLGSYNLRSKTIKIHRLLDQAHVPEFFVSFIVYHEMLHHVLPPLARIRGRRRIHHREFVEREKEFAEYALAKEFSRNLKMQLFKKRSFH